MVGAPASRGERQIERAASEILNRWMGLLLLLLPPRTAKKSWFYALIRAPIRTWGWLWRMVGRE